MTQNLTSICPICHAQGKHEFSSADLMFGGTKPYDYHRCTACGVIYQHPLPDNEEIAGFYPESYIVYCQPSRIEFDAVQKAVLKHRYGYDNLTTSWPAAVFAQLAPAARIPEVIPRIEGGTVLDIGCGNGEYLLRLRSIGWNCKGVEFNETAVSICRQHGLDIHHGDLKSANFESGSFDFVTAHHLLEHVPDPHELVGEIARILKPGGTLLIRTPNSNALGRAWFGNNWYANDVPRHLFLYSEHNLERLANDHGLTLIALSKPAKPKLVLKSLDYQTGNKGKPSKKRKIRKWLANLYVPAAKLTGRGDELFALFSKT
jgi:2-polyprenyl-3-methyl-5-hydroxy-6-metoxy-1,4-benzoquinol methylase